MTPDKLQTIGEWVAIPLVMLTIERGPILRTMGFLSIIPTAPLFAFGSIFFVLPATLWDIWEEL